MQSLTITPAGKVSTLKHNPAGPFDSSPSDLAEIFSARWIGEGGVDFPEGDIFDAYIDGDETAWGLSLRGDWVKIGPENRNWEWVKYNPCGGKRAAFKASAVKGNPAARSKEMPKKRYFVYQDDVLVAGPIDKDGAVIRIYHDPSLVYYEALNLAQLEKMLSYGEIPAGLHPVSALAKPNGRRSKVSTPRRWYFVNHENGVVIGPISRAQAVRMSEDANLNHGGDTTAASEAAMNRDYHNEVNSFYKLPTLEFTAPTKRNPGGVWHVHYKDTAGKLWFVVGSRAHGATVDIDTKESLALKLGKERAVALARKLQKRYDRVMGGSGRFFAETAVEVKPNGPLDEGFKAYNEGKPRGANPYHHQKQNAAHSLWENGYLRARALALGENWPDD